MTTKELYELLQTIKAIKSRKDKTEKLKEYFIKYPELATFVKQVHSPRVNISGVKLPTEFDRYQKFNMSMSEFYSLIDKLMDLGEDDKRDEYIKSIAGSLSESDLEIFKCVVNRTLNSGVGVVSINEAAGHELIYTPPYLRSSDTETIPVDFFDKTVLIQPKHTGIFVNVIFNRNTVNPIKIMLRNGTVLNNRHPALRDIVAHAIEIGKEEKNDFVIMGELTFTDVNAPNDYLSHQILHRILTNQDTAEFNAALVAWDYVPISYFNAKSKYHVGYIERYTALYNMLFFTNKNTAIRLCKYTEVDNAEDAKSHTIELIRKGYEGAVIKRADGYWFDGTSEDNYKIKPLIDVDLFVSAVKLDDDGLISSIKVENSNVDNLLLTDTVPLTGKDRKQEFTKLHKEVDLVGKVVTVQCNSFKVAKNLFYKDMPKDFSVLRHPRIVTMRLDKNSVDTFTKINKKVAEYLW